MLKRGVVNLRSTGAAERCRRNAIAPAGEAGWLILITLPTALLSASPLLMTAVLSPVLWLMIVAILTKRDLIARGQS